MKKRSSVEVYLSVVFKWGITILVSAVMAAAVTFTTMKIAGVYPDVSWIALLLFDCMDIVFFTTGMILVKTGFEDGYLKEGRLKAGKIFVTFVLILQWNYILYMIPSRTFWGFLFFFVILIAFFLDMRLVIFNGVACMVSLFIGWAVKGTLLMPVKDELFIGDIIITLMSLVLSLAGLCIFIFLMTHFLVNAKKDELEENNRRVQGVLDKAAAITERLGEASGVLLATSQNESASTEELSAISENLMEGSDNIMERAKESKQNLAELEKSTSDMVERIGQVNEMSQNLLSTATSSEQAMNNLIAISEQVEKSTQSTLSVTGKLQEEVGEIGKTLDIINEIAASTSLLALNASIEAARAGEAGRGFAVVAQEVGNLASNTKDSLDSVNTVILRVTEGTEDVARYVNESASHMRKQNQVMVDTIQGVRNMLVLLKQSVDVITSVTGLQKRQDEVIGTTIAISENIANGIVEENAQFSNIAEMVQNNTEEITTLAAQVDVLNKLVQELNELLEE